MGLKIAEKDELESIFRLRYKVYNELGWICNLGYDSKSESDKYDSHSKHFVINDHEGKNIIGTVRLIYIFDGYKLPVQNEFAIELPEPVSRCFEISRLIIEKEYRGIKMLTEILDSIHKFALSEGLTYSYAILEEKFIKVLNRMGYQFEALKKGKRFGNEYKVPALWVIPYEKM